MTWIKTTYERGRETIEDICEGCGLTADWLAHWRWRRENGDYDPPPPPPSYATAEEPTEPPPDAPHPTSVAITAKVDRFIFRLLEALYELTGRYAGDWIRTFPPDQRAVRLQRLLMVAECKTGRVVKVL